MHYAGVKADLNYGILIMSGLLYVADMAAISKPYLLSLTLCLYLLYLYTKMTVPKQCKHITVLSLTCCNMNIEKKFMPRHKVTLKVN